MNFLWSTVINILTDLVFPVFRDLLKSSLSVHLDELANSIKQQVDVMTNSQSKTAQEKAQDAEQKSNNATNPEDIAKYQAVSDVWKEVAEGLKSENKNLKHKIKLNATISEELVEYKAKVETWQEAYESLRNENENLKIEITNIKNEAVSSLQNSVEKLKMTDLFDISKPDQISLNKQSLLLNPSSDKDI